MIDITYINHSTCYIRIDDICILTDPIWSNWLGIPILGVHRKKEPGIRIAEIPKLDYVLISHNHFDHMDIPTLKYLQSKFSPIFLSGLGNRKFLNDIGIVPVIQSDWWEKYPLLNTNIWFVPAQHWSGRLPWNIDKTLWGGFIIETPEGYIYFAGDTGYGKFFEDIKNKFPNIILSLLPIAPDHVYMKIQHMNTDDAVKAHKDLNSKLSIGIHSGTFFSNDKDTKIKLEKSIKTNKLNKDEFIILEHGESRKI